MGKKGILILIFVLALVVIEGYLITTSVLDKISQDKSVQSFCVQKCNFNQTSSFWEFSGENAIKGFTTKDECFNYCSKVKMGFAYILKDYASAFLGAISSIFKK
jgi:hypothetical protein